MNWYKTAETVSNSKTHPDPWQMTMDEINAYEKPQFETDQNSYVGYHITNRDNVVPILNEGLRMSKAKGLSYGEPNWIWAYLRENFAEQNSYVVFKVPNNDSYVDQPNEVSIRLIRDVKPEEMLYGFRRYKIKVEGVVFEGHLYEFKGRDLWHKLCVKWAVEKGLYVPQEIADTYEVDL